MPLSFFFVCSFGGFLRYFLCFPPFGWEFFFKGCGLGVVLGELFPVLSQSVNWFRGLVVEERKRMSEVRSSELEIGLSSNEDPAGGDTAVSTPQEVRAFYAFEKVCGLDGETLGRFKDRF